MTSSQQDRDFIVGIIGDILLEDAIKWIANNLQPEDVFSGTQLGDWAIDNGWTTDNDDDYL